MKGKGKRYLKKCMFDYSKNFISVFINFPLISGQKPEQDTGRKEKNISNFLLGQIES